MGAVDVIYPVRDGDDNPELKFSLRSLAMNLGGYGTVWVVGFKPSWLTGVEFLPGNDAPWPRANLWRNLTLACDHPDIADDVLIMNDDFLFIGPHPQPVPVLYRGQLRDQLAKVHKRAGPRGWWQESLVATMRALNAAGFENPISYELHTPFPCRKTLMAETLERFARVTPHNPPQWRTLYGVTHNIGGRVHPDGKVLRPGPLVRPYMSTDDVSWRHFAAQMRQVFPQPSCFEVEPQSRAHPRPKVPARTQRTVRRIRA